MAGCTTEEFALAIPKMIGGKRMDLPVFNALTEHCITTPAEFPIIKRSGRGKYEVLLFQRPDDDHFFPGRWHVSGGVMLPRRSAKMVWEGMTEKYALYAFTFVEPRWAGQVMTPKYDEARHRKGDHYSLRGPEVNTVYMVEFFAGDVATTKGGTFFPVNALPETILPHHPAIIQVAVRFRDTGRPSLFDTIP